MKKLWIIICLIAMGFVEVQSKSINLEIINNSYTFNLPERSGLMSSYAYVDYEKNLYIRGVKIPNKPINFIETYDLNTGKLIKSLELSGLVHIGNFCLLNNYYLIRDLHDNSLKKFDKFGILVNIYEDGNVDVQGGYTRYYANTNFNHLHYFNNKIYTLTGLMVNKENTNAEELDRSGIIVEYDLSEKKMDLIGDIPKDLYSGNYGQLNNFSSTSFEDKLIISPFFNNDIYVYKLNESEFFSINKKYPIILEMPKYFNKLKHNQLEHYNNSGHFVAILYNHFKKEYYRFYSKSTQTKGKPDLKIVVLDELFNFNRIINLPPNYSIVGCFISQKGLNMINLHSYNRNNNFLSFDTLIF